jgi:hypothetical protein
MEPNRRSTITRDIHALNQQLRAAVERFKKRQAEANGAEPANATTLPLPPADGGPQAAG